MGVQANEVRQVSESNYTVERHGGRSNNAWKVVYKTKDKEKAISDYDKRKIAMRQGGLRLILNDEIIREYHAPLLRSRW